MMGDVTICIPTWQSAAFIERTLACASAQTHPHLRIVVSVDPSDDDTLGLCRAHAAQDGRIEVIPQSRRLGWSQNANAALDAATSEFFCLYFHDDVIAPDYVATLVAALDAHPEAVSTHCHLEEFGLVSATVPAHDYTGTPLRRLVDFLLTRRGTTLRSLIRNVPTTRDLRFPVVPGDNHWAAYLFHVDLLAAGPAIAVHETLYSRWQRPGSLTRSAPWTDQRAEALLASQDAAIPRAWRVLCEAAGTDAERALGRYCLRLFALWFYRHCQSITNDSGLTDPTAEHPVLAPADRSSALASCDEEMASWMRTMEDAIGSLERQIVAQKAPAR